MSPGRVTLVDGKRPSLPADDGSAVRVRALGQADGPPAADGEVVLRLEVAPEPRLRWQRTVGVEVTKATDDRGQALEPVRAADPAAIARVVPVRFKAGQTPPASLRELSGTIALQVLAEPQTSVTVDGLLDAGGKAVKGADGAAVRVSGVTKEAGGRVQVKFAIDPAGAPAGLLGHMSMRAGRMVMTTGPGATAEHEVAVADEKGERLVLTSCGVQVAGGGAEYTLVCQPGPGQGAPAKLVYAVSKSVTVDVPFALRNVPLK